MVRCCPARFVGLVLSIAYTILLYGIYVPDWEYQISGPGSEKSFSVSAKCHCIFFILSQVQYTILKKRWRSCYIWIRQVKCGVRGDTGPACNAVGMVDRTILGIDHLYRRPVYARTKVWYEVQSHSFLLPCHKTQSKILANMQECSINYPENGPLPPDAPSWCQAPFDPEGLLRSVLH
jgi:heparan-alpha-glucosaminide N-acetyltransferase